MNRKTLLTAVFIIAIFVLGIWFFGSKPADVSIPASNSIVLYYGNTCPHCKELDELIKKDNLKDKVHFVEKEVFSNRQNAKELNEVARNCGISQLTMEVPFLYAEGKCLTGTTDIFAYLSQKATASANVSNNKNSVK